LADLLADLGETILLGQNGRLKETLILLTQLINTLLSCAVWPIFWPISPELSRIAFIGLAEPANRTPHRTISSSAMLSTKPIEALA
jgi:hypothetical protein